MLQLAPTAKPEMRQLVELEMTRLAQQLPPKRTMHRTSVPSETDGVQQSRGHEDDEARQA